MATGASGALVALGGDLVCRGRGPTPDGRWVIGRPGRRPIQLMIGAVATSTVMRRRWQAPDGSTRHHVVDPRSGRPTDGIRTATVIAADGWWAEAVATRLMVEGLLLAAGFLDRDPPKRWILGVHRWLGGLTVAFTAVHVGALWLDSYVQYSLSDLLVPFANSQVPGRWATAWGGHRRMAPAGRTGQLAGDATAPPPLVAGHPSDELRGAGDGDVHGATAGTDASHTAYVGGVIVVTLLTVFLTTYRVLTRRRPSARRPQPAEVG